MAIGLLGSDQKGSIKETKNLLLVKREKREKEGERKKKMYLQILDQLLHIQATNLVPRGGGSGGKIIIRLNRFLFINN